MVEPSAIVRSVLAADLACDEARLGFAVLLKAFMLYGRFPRQRRDVPGAFVVHVVNQVRGSADLYPSYEWSGRMIEYHRAQLREFLVSASRPSKTATSSSTG